jgi:hypothetical protein
MATETQAVFAALLSPAMAAHIQTAEDPLVTVVGVLVEHPSLSNYGTCFAQRPARPPTSDLLPVPSGSHTPTYVPEDYKEDLASRIGADDEV